MHKIVYIVLGWKCQF